MAQLSRPYQIALGAMAVLAMVWFVALRGHGSSSSEPASSGPAAGAGPKPSSGVAKPSAVAAKPSAKPSAAVKSAARPSSAVKPSAKPSSAAATPSAGAGARSHRVAPLLAHTQAGVRSRAATTVSQRNPGRSGAPNRAPQQIEVERELVRGQTVMLVFWYPKSSVDAAVRAQALALAHGSHGKLAVHVARPDQVGLFGPVTEVVHVYQTPTVLIVNKHGLVSTLTGLTDEFSLKQAVREAERANR